MEFATYKSNNCSQLTVKRNYQVAKCPAAIYDYSIQLISIQFQFLLKGLLKHLQINQLQALRKELVNKEWITMRLSIGQRTAGSPIKQDISLFVQQFTYWYRRVLVHKCCHTIQLLRDNLNYVEWKYFRLDRLNANTLSLIHIPFKFNSQTVLENESC